jgi:hypothetical protein
VLSKMAGTFGELAKRADFSGGGTPHPPPEDADDGGSSGNVDGATAGGGSGAKQADGGGTSLPPLGGIALGGLVYNIQIHLPESRDQAVYDALFRSLKTHLLQ